MRFRVARAGWSAAALVALVPLLVPLLAPLPLAARQVPSPWIRVEAGAEGDNQPRNAQRLRAEYGGYLSPVLALAGTLEAQRTGGGVASSTLAPGARLSAGIVPLRLELEGSAALLVGDVPGGPEPLLSGRVGFRVAQGTAIVVRFDRDRYTSTVASVDTLVVRRAAELSLDRSGAPGWAFQGTVRREGFGDGNAVRTAFAWILAPVSASATHRIRLGYAHARQDSDESRWEPDGMRRRGLGPPGSGDSIPGRYAPYHTPEDLVVHGVLAEGVRSFGESWLTVNANVGVRATEMAPVLQRSLPVPAEPELSFYPRSFRPWQLSARLALPPGRAGSLVLEVRHERTVYYEVTGAAVTLTRAVGGG